ncbi:MAG: SDR family NAD(P)-dependent oxidoreductase, partial [Burkholderiales bacterium]
MDLGLVGRTVLVTASSGGIGRQCALQLAAEGARIVLCARGTEKLETTRAEVAAIAGDANVFAQAADVTSTADMTALVDAATARFGAIDVLVCIGGSPKRGGFLEVNEQDLRDAFELTVVAAFRAIKLVLPGMRAR